MVMAVVGTLTRISGLSELHFEIEAGRKLRYEKKTCRGFILIIRLIHCGRFGALYTILVVFNGFGGVRGIRLARSGFIAVVYVQTDTA